MEDKEDLLSTDLMINQQAYVQLKEIAIWGRIISILSFLYSVVIAVGAVAACIKIVNINNRVEGNKGGIVKAASAGIIYLSVACIVIFLSLYLFKFSKNMLGAFTNNNQQQLALSFQNLKIFFRFTGILAIILLVLTLFAIIGILITVSKN